MPMPVQVEETSLPGVLVVKAGIVRDERGFFSEIYSERMFAEAGIRETFVQDNLSLSCKGVFRGLHYQIEPHAMGKLVRAIRGAVFDVVLDIRKGSPTFGKWQGFTLSEENHRAVWAPPGFAHGFLTLEDDTLFHYKCTAIHTPEAERAIRYDDPAIELALPVKPEVLSDRDVQAPLLKDAEYNFTYEA
jgi:dTDP-4-dehydrorhamnose 3,5-epimerase